MRGSAGPSVWVSPWGNREDEHKGWLWLAGLSFRPLPLPSMPNLATLSGRSNLSPSTHPALPPFHPMSSSLKLSEEGFL